MSRVDILDVLLDEENTENIFMWNEKGEEIEFSQVAVIPYEDDLYCILKPLQEIPGVKDDEAIAFKVVENKKGSYLTVETNEVKAVKIFIEYYKLLQEELEA